MSDTCFHYFNGGFTCHDCGIKRNEIVSNNCVIPEAEIEQLKELQAEISSQPLSNAVTFVGADDDNPFISSINSIDMSKIVVPEHHLDLIQRLKDSQQSMIDEIIQLKAQIYVLKDERLRSYDGMAERLERYRAALEFYAGPGSEVHRSTSIVGQYQIIDRGQIAREALK
jgi:hypothetical protein